MKPEKLSDCIGEIDEELIEGAEKKKTGRSRTIIIAAGSMAACLAAAAAVFIAVNLFSGANPAETGGNSSEVSSVLTGGAEASAQSLSEAEVTDPEEGGFEGGIVATITTDVYYIKDGKMEQEAYTHSDLEEQPFAKWKELNNIGDEVKLISMKAETVIIEPITVSHEGESMVRTGEYYFILNVTVSKNLEEYFTGNREMMLESLKKTMTAHYMRPEVRECNIIFEEAE